MGRNDWVGDWNATHLPDEAVIEDEGGLEIDDEWLEGAGPDLKKEAMKAWFLARYCDPALETPYMSSEGGYIWVHGGPFHPNEELQSRFGDQVADSLIADVVNDLVLNVGYDWAPRHWADEYYDEFGVEVESEKQPSDYLEIRLNQVSELLTVQGTATTIALIEQLAYVNVITAFESYLWETMSYAVENDPRTLEDIVTKHKALSEQKISLGEIYKKFTALKDTVKGFLQNLVWHRFDVVAPLVVHGLRIKPPSFEPFIEPVIKRHDIVHRSGNTKNGEPIELTSAEIVDLVAKVRQFAHELDHAIRVRNAKEAFEEADIAMKAAAPAALAAAPAGGEDPF